MGEETGEAGGSGRESEGQPGGQARLLVSQDQGEKEHRRISVKGQMQAPRLAEVNPRDSLLPSGTPGIQFQ